MSRYLAIAVCFSLLQVATAQAQIDGAVAADQESLAASSAEPTETRDAPGRAAASRVGFSRDVRPILSDKCFACHGPDETQREADLRLDDRQAALDAGSDGPVILPGKPEQSELIRRIRSADADVRMPPVESGKKLTAAEIELLSRWILQGAEYEAHWSFLPLADRQPPELNDVSQRAWARNGIDHFVLRRLNDQQLSPSPAADRSTLIRRVYLDLIGLLPTPEATREFLRDQRPDAYESLVDRLLRSPHYGERWGRHWLDQARYADSNGYTIDGERVMWPYRDWVIHALNSDLPFDQFTIEQLAGDLLPNATKQQRIATGFHRNTLINQEGGTDPEQFRIEAVMDRVNTTGAVWLGLTVGCAQCHTHKFDPISHREYYELLAFFNQDADVNETGPTEEIHEGEMFLDEEARQSPNLQALYDAVAHAERLRASRPQRQAAWEQAILAETAGRPTPGELPWTVVRPTRTVAEEATLTVLEDQSVLATQGVLREIYVVHSEPLPPNATLGSFQLRVIPDPSLPHNGPGLAANGNFVLSTLEIYLGDELLPLVAASGTHAQPGYPVAALIDNDPGTGWAINVSPGSSARMNAEHTVWFALGRKVPAEGKALKIVMKHELNNHYNVGRFQFSWSPEVADATSDRNFLAALTTPASERSGDQGRLISTAFAAVDVDYKEARARVERLRRENGLGAAAESMILTRAAESRHTYVFTRGDFLRPNKRLGVIRPDVLDVLPPLISSTAEDEAEPTRLDLARWLVSDEHPLTARVTVNRIWMRYFGHGLVLTENDFGAQGSPPTHPELLDWLARQFIESGWSQKDLHRLIVTSATYRQASHHNGPSAVEAAKIDPLNRWLWRQNRLRLDAEIVRDVLLSASGKLNPTIGGPSVQPPQPEGVYAFTQNRKNWKAATDERRFRRGMYTMFYRSAPYPLLTTFDAPDFQSVCTSRPRSNTPLQALTMANDSAMFELTQALGRRICAERVEDPVAELFWLTLCREPQVQERQRIEAFVKQQTHDFADREADALAVVGATDESPAASPQALAELAAWTAAARAIVNADEFITRE